MSESQSQHWTNYWSFGYLTSLPQDFESNYDGELSAFWSQQFNQLRAGARVLDVCTGNGAVALLAARFSRQYDRRFQITALDAAIPNPQALGSRFGDLSQLISKINFVSGVALEEVNTEQAEVDLVTSQYGIEYCDWEQAAQQVYDLLKPGGRLALIAHETSSEILETMETERGEYRALEDLGLFSVIKAFLSYELGFEEFSQQLKDLMDGLAELQKSAGSPLYLTTFKALEPLVKMDEWTIRQQQAKLAGFLQNLEHARGRLEDMFRVNSAIEADADWVNVFSARGLKRVDNGTILYQNQHRCGQYYCFQKPA